MATYAICRTLLGRRHGPSSRSAVDAHVVVVGARNGPGHRRRGQGEPDRPPAQLRDDAAIHEADGVRRHDRAGLSGHHQRGTGTQPLGGPTTWLSPHSPDHLAVTSLARPPGCPLTRPTTWLSPHSPDHLAVPSLARPPGCPLTRPTTWLSPHSPDHLTVPSLARPPDCPLTRPLTRPTTWLSPHSPDHLAVPSPAQPNPSTCPTAHQFTHPPTTLVIHSPTQFELRHWYNNMFSTCTCHNRDNSLHRHITFLIYMIQHYGSRLVWLIMSGYKDNIIHLASTTSERSKIQDTDCTQDAIIEI